MTKEELKDYLVREASYDPYYINKMTPYELVDAFLSWNGIIGYTSLILDVVEAAFDTALDY